MSSTDSFSLDDSWNSVNSSYFDSEDDYEFGEGNPLQRRSLPTETTSSSFDDLFEESESFSLGAPEGSVYRSVGDSISRQLTGFNKSELQRGFQRAWQKDKQLGKVLGGIKMSARCIGFAVGTAINLAARIATIPIALGFGALSAVAQFVFTPLKTFKKPKKVLQNTFTGGIVGGVIVGSCIGVIGMKISKTMMGIKLEREDDGRRDTLFDRTGKDNALPAMVGAGVAVGVACAYPAMWQLPLAL